MIIRVAGAVSVITLRRLCRENGCVFSSGDSRNSSNMDAYSSPGFLASVSDSVRSCCAKETNLGLITRVIRLLGILGLLGY
jgi:hypothetical protein